MDINSVTAMLNGIPTSRSNYEFKNFNLEQYGTFPRQLRAMLLEKESLHNQLSEIEAEIDIITTESALASVETLAAVVRRDSSRVSQMNRRLVDIKQQMQQVDNWLDLQDPEDCQDAIDNFEEYESDHWTDTLGKEAAIEVLSHGRTQKSTLAQLSQLPLSDYKRAVVIIAQLANFLKDTTEKAESVLYPQMDTLPNSNNQQLS